MYFYGVALFISLFGASSGKLQEVVTDEINSTKREWGGRKVRKQCYVDKKPYPDDLPGNPVFGGTGFAGSFTLGECKAECEKGLKDSRGRPCIGIEWSDRTLDWAADVKRNCALLWGCDTLAGNPSGSVYLLDWGERQKRQQCYVDKRQYKATDVAGDPIFGPSGTAGLATLADCKAECDNGIKDEHGRPCIGIEWNDRALEWPADEKRHCAYLWGCDSLHGNPGGSVWLKDGEGPKKTTIALE